MYAHLAKSGNFVSNVDVCCLCDSIRSGDSLARAIHIKLIYVLRFFSFSRIIYSCEALTELPIEKTERKPIYY